MGGNAGDGDAAYGQVVGVDDCLCSAAAHGLSRAVDIGVAGRNCEGLANFGLGKDVGAGSGTRDGGARSTPLVTYVAQAVQVGERIGSCQCLPLCGGARDGHSASWAAIDKQMISERPERVSIHKTIQINNSISARQVI